MGNYLKVDKKQQVISLLGLGWTYRRIQRETGVRRETVARYNKARSSKPAKVFPGLAEDPGAESQHIFESDSPKAAKVFPGSDSKPAKTFPGSDRPRRSAAAVHHDSIVSKLDEGLTIQRIYQDLVSEYGYAHSYESVKRYVRTLIRTQKVVGVLHSEPGEEGQVDFFRGAPVWVPEKGQWRRPWVFRLTLSHSRHGYEEAVWDQKIETFLRLHERAFRDLGGVPLVIKHDNLKAAVVKACLYDPDMNVVYEAFAKHWGFTPLPIIPGNPKENGKEERSGGYVKSNALKGKRFNSLQEQNEYLKNWNRTIARLRIHGTTRKQVWTHFLETDQPALQPLASDPFLIFQCGERIVHPDGHVEVAGSFYPVPSKLLGCKVQIRWDDKLVRVYLCQELQAIHARVAAGQFAPPQGQKEPVTSSQKAYTQKLLGKCRRVGEDMHAWAEAAIDARGVRAIRLLQGVLRLTREHSREVVLHASRLALKNHLFRYRDMRQLSERSDRAPEQMKLLDVHPSIRPVSDYRLEDFV